MQPSVVNVLESILRLAKLMIRLRTYDCASHRCFWYVSEPRCLDVGASLQQRNEDIAILLALQRGKPLAKFSNMHAPELWRGVCEQSAGHVGVGLAQQLVVCISLQRQPLQHRK